MPASAKTAPSHQVTLFLYFKTFQLNWYILFYSRQKFWKKFFFNIKKVFQVSSFVWRRTWFFKSQFLLEDIIKESANTFSFKSLSKVILRSFWIKKLFQYYLYIELFFEHSGFDQCLIVNTKLLLTFDCRAKLCDSKHWLQSQNRNNNI